MIDELRTRYQTTERAFLLLTQDPSTEPLGNAGLLQLQHHACEYMAGRYDEDLFERTIKATERNVLDGNR